MSIATILYSSIETSRLLTNEELKEFNSICFIDIKNFVIANNKCLTFDAPFDYFNSWKINEQNLYIKIKEGEEEFYFIESLLYLIEKFFQPKGVILNGRLNGYDDIFGCLFSFVVVNNEIMFDFSSIKYMEYQNYQSISDIDNMLKNMNLNT